MPQQLSVYIEKRWWIIVGLLFITSIFLDVYTTQEILKDDNFYEANPIMNLVIGKEIPSLMYIYLNVFLMIILVVYLYIEKSEIKQLHTTYKLCLFIALVVVTIIRLSGGIHNLYLLINLN